MADMFRCIFAQGVVSQALSCLALALLVVSIAQVSRILATGCVRACRSWMLAIRYTRRARRLREASRTSLRRAPPEPK